MSDAEPSPQDPSRRLHDRLRKLTPSVLIVVGLGLAVHVLYPQLGELDKGLEALRSGRWTLLLVAIAASALTPVAAAWTVRASVDVRLPWADTTLVQVGAGFISSITPVAIGGVTANQSYLHKRGVDPVTAAGAVGVNVGLTAVSHLGLLLVMLPFLPGTALPSIPRPGFETLLEIGVGVTIVVGALLWIPTSRRRLLSGLAPARSSVRTALSDPRRAAEMLGSVVVMNLIYGVALWASVGAFGPAPGFSGVLEVYLIAAVVAAVSPTPGGLGPMEAALIATLGRLSVPAGQAIAATLAFRIATFWLPLVAGAIALSVARRRGLV